MSSYSNTYFRVSSQYYESVDTDGSAVTFSVPVNEVLIEASGDFAITGNYADDNEADALFTAAYGPHRLPIGGQADATLFTIKAQADTINVSVLGFR